VLKAKAKTRAKTNLLFCGSGLAREKPETAAFIQNAHFIVNELREQARSHIFDRARFSF
jgi:hypothetical protein